MYALRRPTPSHPVPLRPLSPSPAWRRSAADQTGLLPPDSAIILNTTHLIIALAAVPSAAAAFRTRLAPYRNRRPAACYRRHSAIASRRPAASKPVQHHSGGGALRLGGGPAATAARSPALPGLPHDRPVVPPRHRDRSEAPGPVHRPAPRSWQATLRRSTARTGRSRPAATSCARSWLGPRRCRRSSGRLRRRPSSSRWR